MKRFNEVIQAVIRGEHCTNDEMRSCIRQWASLHRRKEWIAGQRADKGQPGRPRYGMLEGEKDLIELVEKCVIDGMNRAQTSDLLNDSGYRTRAGLRWTPNSLKNIWLRILHEKRDRSHELN